MRRQDILVAAGASLLSATVAGFVSWTVAKKKFTADFTERVDQEVRESVAFLTRNTDLVIDDDIEEDEQDPLIVVGEDGLEIDSTGPTAVFQALAEKYKAEVGDQPTRQDLEEVEQHRVRYDKILTSEGYKDPTEEPEPVPIVGGWDPGCDEITVISRDIFMENTSGFEQSSLSYFVDNAVIDADSELVPDHELLIGSGPPPFGQMSEDPEIVYIRNRKISAEYEVIHDPGKATDFLMHSLYDIYNPSQRQ